MDKSNESSVNTPRNPRISREEFILAWERSKTIMEVAQDLDRTFASVSSRAYQLRGNGIPLKKMESGKPNRRKTSLNDSLAILAKVRGLPIEAVKAESDALKEGKKQGATS